MTAPGANGHRPDRPPANDLAGIPFASALAALYVTDIPVEPVGAFTGPLAVRMRPVRADLFGLTCDIKLGRWPL
jgi:hypothetical protein